MTGEFPLLLCGDQQQSHSHTVKPNRPPQGLQLDV